MKKQNEELKELSKSQIKVISRTITDDFINAMDSIDDTSKMSKRVLPDIIENTDRLMRRIEINVMANIAAENIRRDMDKKDKKVKKSKKQIYGNCNKWLLWWI